MPWLENAPLDQCSRFIDAYRAGGFTMTERVTRAPASPRGSDWSHLPPWRPSAASQLSITTRALRSGPARGRIMRKPPPPGITAYRAWVFCALNAAALNSTRCCPRRNLGAVWSSTMTNCPRPSRVEHTAYRACRNLQPSTQPRAGRSSRRSSTRSESSWRFSRWDRGTSMRAGGQTSSRMRRSSTRYRP